MFPANEHGGGAPKTGFENGAVIPVTEFSHDSFDVPIEILQREARLAEREERMLGMMRSLYEFIEGPRNGTDGGFRMRRLVWKWHVYATDEGQAEFARRHGLTKQNFGRSVQQWRDKLNWRDPRYYAAQARESAKKRERVKRATAAKAATPPPVRNLFPSGPSKGLRHLGKKP